MKQYLPLIFTILTVFGNYYIPILNKANVKDINEDNKLYAQPAGYTFSIWGIIYTGLIYLSYRLIVGKSTWENNILILYILSCIFNLLWMYLWTKNKIQISQIILFLIVISLSFLWVLNFKSNDNIVQNIIMMYIAWTVGASLLNIFIANFKNTVNNSKIIIYILSVVQILFQVFLYFTNNINYYNQSITFPLVGLWTGIGILANKNKNLGLTKNILPIISLISSIFHANKLNY